MSDHSRVNGDRCSKGQEIRKILMRRWGLLRGWLVGDFIFAVRDGVAALQAGLDLEMPIPMMLPGFVPQALAEGRLALLWIDGAVQRQLRLPVRIPSGVHLLSLRRGPEPLAPAPEPVGA